MAAGVEIPFWIFGQQKWVSGINRNTTCAEVKLVQMISSRFNKIYFNLSSVVRRQILILSLHLQILTVTQQQRGHEEQSLYLLKTSSTSSNEPYNRQGWSRL